MSTTWWLLILPLVLSSKLNVPRVLLPLSPSSPVNFTLEVTDGGCYSWSSSRPDVVLVIPHTDSKKCSTKATIAPTGVFNHKASAIIMAKNLENNQLLRCDVILNHIHSLQISMKTHELFIEDAPEEFHVRAWDSQGNEFSSLSGLSFNWTFGEHLHSGSSYSDPILKWVKFENSLYDVDPSVARLEKQGMKGHIVLIEGIKTGSTSVFVQLQDIFFKNVPSVKVDVIVVANLVLEPVEVYVVPGSIIPLAVHIIQYGKANKISFPSSEYFFETENSDVALLVENTSNVQARNIGSTRVFLRDHNMENHVTHSHTFYVMIHVVYPNSLKINLLPYRSWTTVIDEIHSVQVEMYDQNEHLILFNDFVNVETIIPSTFEVDYATTNKSYYHGIVKRLGNYQFTASLKAISANGKEIPLSQTLKTSALLNVLPRIELKPAEYILAWDHYIKPSYQVKYEVLNSGKPYQLIASDTSFATVSNSGEVTTRGSGLSTITAYFLEYPHIQTDAKVYVLPVTNLSVGFHLVEIEIGVNIDIPVYMKTLLPNGSYAFIDDCLQIPLDLQLNNHNLFEVRHSSIASAIQSGSGGCRSISVLASGVGITTLTLTLKTEVSVLEQAVILSSFNQLRHLRPRKGVIILATGSCKTIIYEGGPSAKTPGSKQVQQVSVTNNKVVRSTRPDDITKAGPKYGDIYEFEVCCDSEGEAEVRFSLNSSSSDPHVRLAEASIATKVICAYPYKINLVPVIRTPTVTNKQSICKLQTDVCTIQNYIDSKINLIIEDQIGRRIDHFSNYRITTQVSDKNLGTLKYIKAEESLEESGLHDCLDFKPTGQEGILTLEVSLSNPTLLDDDHQMVVGKLKLNLVNPMAVAPRRNAVLNHPNVKLFLKVTGGSGTFGVNYEPRDVALIQQFVQNNSLGIIPQRSGNLTLSVNDLCLWTTEPSIASVQIVEISRIHLQVLDKIELGSSVQLTVHVYDSSDNLFDQDSLQFIQLEPILGSSIVRVKGTSPVDFILEGIELGETTIGFRAANIESPVVSIQVFPPLKIIPRNVTLIVGSAFQVTGVGGPQPDVVIQYSVDDTGIASCSNNGIITAQKLGHTKLYARALGVDRYTGSERIYSVNKVDVYVKPLSGIRIVAPMTRLRQDSIMPISLAGLDDVETPFTFGDCTPALKIEWTLTNHLSGAISSLLVNGSDSSIGDSDVTIRFKALQPGQTSLKVRVISTLDTQLLKVKEFFDEITLNVYESLSVQNIDVSPADYLLMMPDSVLNLKTNLASKRVVQHSPENPHQLIQLDNDDNLRSGSTTGHVNLLLSASNNYGIVQNRNLFVEVRPVSYMLVTASHTFWDKISQKVVFPRGFEIKLSISYHDSLGRKFHATQNNLKLKASRHDNHRILYEPRQSAVYFKADQQGSAVLQFSDGVHRSLDVYVHVEIVNVIFPEESYLVLGDVVCFYNTLLPSNSFTGKWLSDSDLLHLDETTGIALAVGEGSGVIKYLTSDGQAAVLDITILPASNIRFLDESRKILTNVINKIYYFPVALRNDSSASLRNRNFNIDQHGSVFRRLPSRLNCFLTFANEQSESIHDVFYVESEFNVSRGYHQCVIKTVLAPRPSPTLYDSKLLLKAVYGSSSSELELEWEPAFMVKLPEIHFRDAQQIAYIELLIKPSIFKQLEFQTSDTSVLKISDNHIATFDGIKIPVERINYRSPKSPLTVQIRHRLTDQLETVAVKVDSITGDHASIPLTYWLTLLGHLWDFIQYQTLSVLTLFGTCAAIYLGYRALCGTPNRALAPQHTSLHKERSFDSSFMNSSYSRRSPQLWSVSNNDISSSPTNQSVRSPFLSH